VIKICKGCRHASGAHGGDRHCDGCEADGRECPTGSRAYDASFNYLVRPDTVCTTCGHTGHAHEESTYCMSCSLCDCTAFNARGCLEAPDTADKLGLRSPDAWVKIWRERYRTTDLSAEAVTLDLVQRVQADAVRCAGGFDLEAIQSAETTALRERIARLEQIPAIALVDRLRDGE